MSIFLSPFASETLVSRGVFGRPVSRHRAHSQHNNYITLHYYYTIYYTMNRLNLVLIITHGPLSPSSRFPRCTVYYSLEIDNGVHLSIIPSTAAAIDRVSPDRVTTHYLRTDDVTHYRRESAGTKPLVLKVVPR